MYTHFKSKLAAPIHLSDCLSLYTYIIKMKDILFCSLFFSGGISTDLQEKSKRCQNKRKNQTTDSPQLKEFSCKKFRQVSVLTHSWVTVAQWLSNLLCMYSLADKFLICMPVGVYFKRTYYFYSVKQHFTEENYLELLFFGCGNL